MHSPSELARRRPDAAHHAIALKTQPEWTRTFVLSELAKVFDLLDSSEWLEIARVQQDEQRLAGDLEDNPFYQDVTLTTFLHVSLTIVSALQAYVLLYPLPDAAFRPGWNGRAADGSEFDVVAALRATKSQPKDTELPVAGWTALNRLFELVQTDLPGRLTRMQDVWQRILARLAATTLSTGAPALRNGYWYLAEDTSKQREVTATDFAGNGDDLRTRVFTTESCYDGQVVFRDPNLRREPFVAKFGGFHTTLSLEWSASVTGESGVTGALEDVGAEVVGSLFPPFGISEAATEGGLMLWQHTLNADFNTVLYPRRDDARVPENGYDDVFWTPASADDATLADAAHGHFLAVQQGRDVLAYLGLLLTRYCAEYGFAIDLDNNMNSARFASLCGHLFTEVEASAHELLGLSSGQTEPVRS